MERAVLQELLRIQNPASLYERLLDVLEQLAHYDTAAVLQAQPSGDWAICAWRNYDRFVPARLITAFRSRIDHDPLFGEAYTTGAITHITTRQRSLIWRHAQSWIAVPLSLDGAVTAIVSLESTAADAFSPALIETLQDAAPWMALALDNAARFSDLHQTSTTMTQIHEAERDAVADVLHDDIADVLSLIKKSLQRSLSQMNADQDADALQGTVCAITDLSEVVENARRLSHALGARRLLDRFDLLTALEILVDNFARQTQIEVDFSHALPADVYLDPAVKVAIYRVIQEGLTNAAKYAGVDSVELRLSSDARMFSLRLRDTGRGFDVSAAPSGIGLIGMRQRTLLHGGKFDIFSQPGRGTQITAGFPLTVPAAQSNLIAPERIVINLMALARLYGYIRYFHPCDAAAAADWEQLVIEGVQLVETAETDAVLRERLLTLFAPITLDLAIDAPDRLPEYTPDTPADHVMAWRHHGFGAGGSSSDLTFQADTNQIHAIARMQQGARDTSSTYFSEREIYSLESLPEYVPAPDAPLIAPLTDTLVCRLPLALYTRDAKQSPQDMLTAMLNMRTQHYQVDDAQTQGFAALIILWNVFQHFYPRPLDHWDEQLRQGLHHMLERQFSVEQVLRLMVTRLMDAAARVRLHRTRDADADKFVPPFTWAYLGDQVVITRIVNHDGHDLQVGDRVELIDGIPVETLIEAALPFISGTLLEHRRRDALRHLWRGAYGSHLGVDVRRDGVLHYQRVARDLHSGQIPDRDESGTGEVITEFDDGIVYLDLARLQAQHLLRAVSRLEAARGLILDARRMAHTNMSALDLLTAHLIEAPARLLPLHIPKVYQPDRQQFLFQPLPAKTLEPRQVHLSMPVVAVVDHHSRGRVEHYLHLWQDTQRAVLIGQPSAGTLGSTDLFTILDTYDISWTVTRAEIDHPSHFTGVLPDIPCERTREGIQSGQDELLERALVWMRDAL